MTCSDVSMEMFPWESSLERGGPNSSVFNFPRVYSVMTDASLRRGRDTCLSAGPEQNDT